MNDLSKLLSTIMYILLLLLVLVLAVALIFSPDAADRAVAGVTEVLSAMPSFESDFSLINLNTDSLKFDLDFSFKLPEFNLSLEDATVPEFNLSFWMLLLIIPAMFLSAKFMLINTVTTIGITVFAWTFSFQIADTYNAMISAGSTSWQAAGSSFLAMFLVFSLLVYTSSLYLNSAFWGNDLSIGYIVFIPIVLSTIIGAIAAGLSWLSMGLGWGGGLYLILVLSSMLVLLIQLMGKTFHDINEY